MLGQARFDKLELIQVGSVQTNLCWNNKQTTNNTLFRSLVHTYFKSLGYKIKVHQLTQMLFIHHYTSFGKLIKLNSVNIDKSTMFDQALIIRL